MPSNRRRYAQAFPLTYVCVGIAVFACIVTFAVKALMMHQQLKQGAERLRRFRNDLAELKIRNEALQTRKTQLTSTPALQAAIADGTIKLIPIESRVIVDVSLTQGRVATASSQSAVEGGR
jgi:hypothetical protein